MISQNKKDSEIKKLVKKKFPKFDLRTYSKIRKKLTETLVVGIDRIKEPPAKLSERAKEIWRQFWASKSKDIQVLPMDYHLIAAYCTEVAIYYDCREYIAQNGYTFKTPKNYIAHRPEVSIGNQALKNMESIAKEFGFSLKSRKALDMIDGVGVQTSLFESLSKKVGLK